jgi:hypothetical protein
VKFEKRTIQGRFGTAEIQEPFGHCATCARDFFPQRPALQLDSHAVTPRAWRKISWAYAAHKSGKVAAAGLAELLEWPIDERQVHRLAQRAAQEMQQELQQRVADWEQKQADRLLTEPPPRSAAAPPNAPQVVAVEMDGGRLRTRAEDGGHGVFQPHWREMKVGCLLRLQSVEHACDPHPELPRAFLDRPKVQKLVKQLHSQHGSGSSAESVAEEPQHAAENAGEIAIAEVLQAEEPTAAAAQEPTATAPEASTTAAQQPADLPAGATDSWRPRRLVRTCVATQQGVEAFGTMLAAEAAARGFDDAPRKGFVGDGGKENWSVHARHFRLYVAILDFIHLLSYVYSVAMCVCRNADDGWERYQRWILAVWQGQSGDVLREWQELAEQHNVPTSPLPPSDPRHALQRGVTYLQNNLSRTDYPRYRRLGLPVTSTLVESLIKEFNYRVKGTEKFWDDPSGAEAILTLRAALLGEDDRFNAFFADRPGCCYRRRSTQPRRQRCDSVAA